MTLIFASSLGRSASMAVRTWMKGRLEVILTCSMVICLDVTSAVGIVCSFRRLCGWTRDQPELHPLLDRGFSEGERAELAGQREHGAWRVHRDRYLVDAGIGI